MNDIIERIKECIEELENTPLPDEVAGLCMCGEWRNDYCVKCGEHFTDQWGELVDLIERQAIAIKTLENQWTKQEQRIEELRRKTNAR